MTAKERLREIILACSEADAQDMLRLLDEIQAKRAAKSYPAPDTSAEAIRRRLGVEPVSAEEFEQHFGDLPTDDEG